jgi:hypothetical protein
MVQKREQAPKCGSNEEEKERERKWRKAVENCVMMFIICVLHRKLIG